MPNFHTATNCSFVEIWLLQFMFIHSQFDNGTFHVASDIIKSSHFGQASSS